MLSHGLHSASGAVSTAMGAAGGCLLGRSPPAERGLGAPRHGRSAPNAEAFVSTGRPPVLGVPRAAPALRRMRKSKSKRKLGGGDDGGDDDASFFFMDGVDDAGGPGGPFINNGGNGGGGGRGGGDDGKHEGGGGGHYDGGEDEIAALVLFLVGTRALFSVSRHVVATLAAPAAETATPIAATAVAAVVA